MGRAKTITIEDFKDRVARNLSEYRVPAGEGEIGALTIELRRPVARSFRAHWTGFKLFFTGSTMLLKTSLRDGKYWTEAYVSPTQPSWVLAFRDKPPDREAGRPRPDDELARPQEIETALGHRQRLIEAGIISPEELIRMEDLDNPLDAIDTFFNYTTFYILKTIDASWQQIGYTADPSVGWDRGELAAASIPIDSALDEGLKKSDIMWITPDTSRDGRAIPCWFVYKDGKAYVLSGERQQIIPDAAHVRDAQVVTRWKGRDALMTEFKAAVRPITAASREEFTEIANLLLNKRQSVTGSPKSNLERLMRECVILELTPRV